MTHTVNATARWKARVLGAAGLAALVVTISVVDQGDSVAQSPRDCPGVSICNGDDAPVPVRQQGTAKVELTRAVAVETSFRAPLHILPVLLAENLFVRQATVTLPPGQVAVEPLPVEFEVPAGKVLSVTFVSADIQMANGLQTPQLAVTTAIPIVNAYLPHHLVAARQSLTQWTVSQAVNLAAISPSNERPLGIRFSRSGGSTGQATVNVTVAGQVFDQ